MGQDGRCAMKCLLLLAIAMGVLAVLLLAQYKHPPPRYYASIPSISRIDDSNLEFIISLGVESRKPLWGRTCLDRGTNVSVAYHGLPLAHATTGAEVCGGWYKQVWVLRCTTMVAQTSKVGGLPRSVADGILADTLRGVAVFEVKFQIQPAGPRASDDGKLATCVVKPFNSRIPPCDVQFS